MDHGSARDITKFRAKQANAIFLTPVPRFADDFAEMSQGWMLDHPPHLLEWAKTVFGTYPKFAKITGNPNDPNKIVIWRLTRAGKFEGVDLYRTSAEDSKFYTNDGKSVEWYKTGLFKTVEKLLWNRVHTHMLDKYAQNQREWVQHNMGGAALYPLWVRAEKPFDFENPLHRKLVDAELRKLLIGDMSMNDPTWHALDAEINLRMHKIQQGSWPEIEEVEVQQILRDNKFDSFYVLEDGIKNLAVYDPNQVKAPPGSL